ncbi:MAG: patatin-like phospholipase family protein [Acidobacteria bacterium]|nr:patatin-like phospholipase family protein [Acidobacteriota bacterium]
MPSLPARPPGKDAVCFTAGAKGAPFNAGVIHAYLAADREPPKIAAGISIGALSAAAMQRCYQELAKAPAGGQREARRWTWFRRYFEDLSYDPLNVIWHAVPDPVDFFADKPPVADLSCPRPLRHKEEEARRRYHRLVKLGVWLAGMRVSIRDIASTIVHYVRFKEQYGGWPLQAVLCLARSLKMALLVFVHFVASPAWLAEGKKRRPLFGWPAWIGAVALAVALLYRILRLASGSTLLEKALPFFEGTPAWIINWLKLLPEIRQWDSAALSAVLWVATVGGLVLLLAVFLRPGVILRYFCNQLGISRGLLHDYQLHRRLFELFRDDQSPDEPPTVKGPEDGAMHLLLVSAPLRTFRGMRGRHLWASRGASLIDALRASLAVPGIFPPVRLRQAEIAVWLADLRLQRLPRRLDLVDGSAVRENPVPAFFSWLRRHPEIAAELCAQYVGDAAMHLVYDVPIDPFEPPDEGSRERINIVDAAFAGLQLARRRDIKLWYRQAKFIGQLEFHIRNAPNLHARAAPGDSQEDKPGVVRVFPVFADEIAPGDEIRFENNLAPSREEFLRTAASGCRRTLETLYPAQLLEMSARESRVPCHRLLLDIAPRRQSWISPASPGLSEVCRACTRELVYRPAGEPRPPGIRQSYGEPEGRLNLPEKFAHLNGTRPRVVFVASGGVFRGSFHIGVLGAMQAVGLKPDLIVGASVGALLGGTLGAMSVLDPEQAAALLGDLCLTFLRVDQRVALTRTLKNAAKQLGIRARRIDISPARLRRMIRRGTRKDPGFAVAGAPPALIDAISNLFLLPHEHTRAIAASFVAGHITKAMKEFWVQVQAETLRRLDIEFALMGTSLLEPVARSLLGGTRGIAMNNCQPYHRGEHPVSFFSTTSYLNQRMSLLLGRDFLRDSPSYDFVKAALSSSAFPAVFSPRQESEVLPGEGRTDLLFADGGIFDNLPFFPALEILSAVQAGYRRTAGAAPDPWEFLHQRWQRPDLMIAGSLEGQSSSPRNKALRGLSAKDDLSANVKLDSFEITSNVVGRLTGQLLDGYASQPLPEQVGAFMDQIVPAAVLKVAPADTDHLNPTFAFCAATGLDPARVRLSIADGCFQTLRSLEGAQRAEPDSMIRRAVDGLGPDRLPPVSRIQPASTSRDSNCPYFRVAGQPLRCPFVTAAQGLGGGKDEVQEIYSTCFDDRAHRTK